MDTRIKFKEVSRFYRNLKADYKSGKGPCKGDKKRSYLRLIRLLFMNVWNGLTAPIIYPIWYMFRKSITNKIYKGTTWEIINKMIDDNQTEDVKKILKSNGGSFIYWLWTYGDLRDPLGRGELPEDGYKGKFKNNFIGRYYENAIRNVRFSTNFMEFRTGITVEVVIVLDERDFTYMHKSDGIGDSPDGIYFKWMLDNNGRWGFIYEDNNSENIFYFGYVGLLKKDIGQNGRFETSYRKTDSSYHK
jgi:hypothetical protein